MNLEIDGIPIKITRKAIKNINLRIYPPDGQVKMSVPLVYSERAIRRCLEDKLPWIHYQRERLSAIDYPTESPLHSGSLIEFKGKSYVLLIEKHNGPSHIELNDQFILCFTDKITDLDALIERWYRREMNTLITTHITHWEEKIGVKVNEWGIKKMKTRWGSCNTRAARIWLNLNLIKKPVDCFEYVLVHELVHLIERGHNKRFYALMSQFMPNWRKLQLILES